eukprot:g8912.t1
MFGEGFESVRPTRMIRRRLNCAVGFRPGQIQWEGVQDMVYILNQGQSASQDVVKRLKQYLRTNSPPVILKALTIVDSLVINCGGALQKKLASDNWPSSFSRLTQHSDKKVKQAALQLISNYSYTYIDNEFGAAFNELADSLVSMGLLLPPPMTMKTDGEVPAADFQQGLDFLQLQFPESSNPAGKSVLDQDTYSEDLLYTVQKINLDVDKLKEALEQCNRASKRLKKCKGTRKDVLDQLNIAWVIAEKCNVWAENMQAFLIQNPKREELTELLDANDRLHSTLGSWEALVSMDIVNGPISDSENEDSPVHDSHFHSDGSTVSECNEVKMETSNEITDRLKAENESLKLALSNAQNANKTALLSAEARFKEELKEVKSKAGFRIKDLMSQVADYELHKTRMRRETEDMQFKLKSADQALQEKSRESIELEGKDSILLYSSEELKEELARAKIQQTEMESRLKEQDSLVEELKLEILDKQADLEAEQANARSKEAKLNDRLQELARQVDAMSRQLEEDKSSKHQVEECERMISTLRLEVKRESILRKKAYNHIRELKGNIRVIARIRPPMKDTQLHEISAKMHDDYTVDLSVDAPGASSTHRVVGDVSRRYEFDACFGPQATQEQVYAETSQLIQSALDGFNVCIFCYGQTGSGKTHTLTGNESAGGIVPQFMQELFNSDTTTETTSVSAYMLELYQEDLLDLLSTSSVKGKLSIRADSESGMVTVKGATIRGATSSEELKSIFDEGLKRRKIATTRCNIESSRSHLIFTVLLERCNVITGTKTRSKITFVDLAGSERIFKSGAVNDKERLNEARAINKSLSALGDVISALTTRETFIPYRNHKLTELMRDSLGGNAKTLMIVNISPLKSDARETLNTLDYAQRAKQVTNSNSRSFETREIAQLKAVIDKQNTEIRLLKASAKLQN